MTSLGGHGFQYTSFEIVPPCLAPVEPILRAANEVEKDRPRVAYLLRFHAFEKAHQLYPTSSGPRVRQFKTLLLERLETDNKRTLAERQRSSDTREMQSFYQQYYQNYVNDLEHACSDDRAHLDRAYTTARVLFQVLSTFNKPESSDAAKEASKRRA